MFKVRRQQNNPITIIRAASGHELSNYEKWKLASIEEGAQQNRIDAIKINNQRVPIDKDTKTAQITLGDLAFKDFICPDDLSTLDCFVINCEIDESLSE